MGKFILTFLILFMFVGCSHNEDNISLLILPQPQSVIRESGELEISNSSFAFVLNGFQSGLISPLRDEFGKLFSNYYNTILTVANHSNFKIKIRKIHNHEIKNILIPKVFFNNFKSEGYILKIQKDGIIINAFTERGAFYGLQTLKQLLIAYRAKGELPFLKIIDYPQLKFRGLMDDISRGPIPNMDFMKYQIRRLSELKYNYLTYYIENVVKTKSHPEFAPKDALTIDEIKKLSSYAKKYRISLIGNFQSFGHFEKILSIPKYAYLGERGTLLSPVKKESYEFLSDIYSELIPAFDSPFFITNCDEPFDLGKGYSKALVDSLGYAEVYKRHILRLDKMVKNYGKRMIIWGDVILKYPVLLNELPKDIIIGTWDYSAVVNANEIIGPFVDSGFQTLVVPGILNSRRIFPDYNVTIKNIDFIKESKGKPNILGTMLTVWDNGGFAFFSNDWYGTTYAAQTAWNFNYISVDNFDTLYCNNILQSNNTFFTSAIHELNKLDRLIPTYLMSNEALKIFSVDKEAEEIDINLTEWDQVLAITENVGNLLSRIGKVKHSKEVKSLQLTKDLYSTLANEKIKLGDFIAKYCRTNNYTKREKIEAIVDYVNLITNEYDNILKEIDELWSFENREHYLKNVQEFIKARIDNIKLLPGIIKNIGCKTNIYKGKYFTEWLSSNIIPVASLKAADKNLLTELGKENKVHPKVTLEFNFDGRTYRWRRIKSQIESINEIHSNQVPFVEYFYATITSVTQRRVNLILSCKARAEVFLNDKIVFNNFKKENQGKLKVIRNVMLLNKKNTLMIKLFSRKPVLRFTFTVKNLRIGGRKNKYKVLE